MPTPGSRRIEDLVLARDADRHGVDQAVAVVARMEAHRAADRGHAEGIAVAADAGHHAGDEMARLGMAGRAEEQRIEAGDRPRAHGEHVAQDAADAGGSALIGLDIARVVVALHLEHDGEPVADIDHAGVLARTLDHLRSRGRQRAQMHLGGLVRAVLVPHGRENAELGQRRRAADQLEDALVFVRLEAVLGDKFGGDGGGVGDHRQFRATGLLPSPGLRGEGGELSILSKASRVRGHLPILCLLERPPHPDCFAIRPRPASGER